MATQTTPLTGSGLLRCRQLLQGRRREGRRRDPRALRRRCDADGADRSRRLRRRRGDSPDVHRLLRELEVDLPRDQEHRRRARGRQVATEQSYMASSWTARRTTCTTATSSTSTRRASSRGSSSGWPDEPAQVARLSASAPRHGPLLAVASSREAPPGAGARRDLTSVARSRPGPGSRSPATTRDRQRPTAARKGRSGSAGSSS